MQVKELLDVSEAVEVMEKWRVRYNDEEGIYQRSVKEYLAAPRCRDVVLLSAGRLFTDQADHLRAALSEDDEESGVLARLEYLVDAYSYAFCDGCQVSLLNAFDYDHLVLVYPDGKVVTENRFGRFSALVDYLEAVAFGLTLKEVAFEAAEMAPGGFVERWLRDADPPPFDASVLPGGRIKLAEVGSLSVESDIDGVSLVRYEFGKRRVLKAFSDIFSVLRWLQRVESKLENLS